jgi:hypothetical protein
MIGALDTTGVVFISQPKGDTLYKQFGFSKHSESDTTSTSHSGIYLFPEEALYLLEKSQLCIKDSDCIDAIASVSKLFSLIPPRPHQQHDYTEYYMNVSPTAFYKVYSTLKDLDYIVFSSYHPFVTKLFTELSKDLHVDLLRGFRSWFSFVIYQPNSRFRKSNPVEPPFAFIHTSTVDSIVPILCIPSRSLDILEHFQSTRYMDAVFDGDQVVFYTQSVSSVVK